MEITAQVGGEMYNTTALGGILRWYDGIQEDLSRIRFR